MKKPTFIISLFLFILILFSCNSNVDNSNVDNNTNTGNSNEKTNNSTNKNAFLKIVNNYKDSKPANSYDSYTLTEAHICKVGLVGYSFDYLDILYNESKTFELSNGISGGYDDVNVNVSFNLVRPNIATNSYSKNVRCNFEKGKTTTITLMSNGSLVVTY